jgi:metal-responsive CopG/Arc/MetJ family transcriptional regulator
MRVNVSLPKELLDRVDATRGDVPRSRFVMRAVEAYLGRGAVEDDVPSPSRSSVAEQAAAPVSSRVMARTSEKALSMVPGVVRGSSLAKSGVVPIPKGKGK